MTINEAKQILSDAGYSIKKEDSNLNESGDSWAYVATYTDEQRDDRITKEIFAFNLVDAAKNAEKDRIKEKMYRYQLTKVELVKK